MPQAETARRASAVSDGATGPALVGAACADMSADAFAGEDDSGPEQRE
jgi:hypothetical protein